MQGSTYTYTYATLGELAAWTIGWDLILEYAMGVGAVACGWSAYFNSLLVQMGMGLPPELLSATGEAIVRADGSPGTAIAHVPAAVIVMIITGAADRRHARIGGAQQRHGRGEADRRAGLHPGRRGLRQHRQLASLHPAQHRRVRQFGISGILRGASIVFFAYIGFDAVSNCAQEARRPQRDMPIGIMGSLALSTVLYIGVAAVLTGLVPYPKLNVADPVVEGARAIGLPWLSLLVEVGALVGLTTVSSCCSTARAASSLPWRLTACCRRSSAASIRGSAHRGSASS